MGKTQGTPEWSVRFIQTTFTGIQGQEIGDELTFKKAKGIYSSEADGVWMWDRKAYKIYAVSGSDTQAVHDKKKALDDAKMKANNVGLPIPDMDTVFCNVHRFDKDDDSKANIIPDHNLFGVALVSKAVSGDLFSLQKNARSGQDPTGTISRLTDLNILDRPVFLPPASCLCLLTHVVLGTEWSVPSKQRMQWASRTPKASSM